MKHTQSNHDRWQGTKMASENRCVSWCRFQCFSSVPPVFCWFQTNHFYFKKVILRHFIQSEHKHIICKLGITLKINAYVGPRTRNSYMDDCRVHLRENYSVTRVAIWYGTKHVQLVHGRHTINIFRVMIQY
jgi:hypothetical protein